MNLSARHRPAAHRCRPPLASVRFLRALSPPRLGGHAHIYALAACILVLLWFLPGSVLWVFFFFVAACKHSSAFILCPCAEVAAFLLQAFGALHTVSGLSSVHFGSRTAWRHGAPSSPLHGLPPITGGASQSGMLLSSVVTFHYPPSHFPVVRMPPRRAHGPASAFRPLCGSACRPTCNRAVHAEGRFVVDVCAAQ